MELRGGRVILREKRLEDAWNDYQWRSDPELARLDAATPLNTSFEQYLRFYQDELRYPTPSSRRFAIQTLDGRHIGNCMLYDIDTLRGEAEVGIMIGDRNYWGQGYGYDALVTLINYTFSHSSLVRLYLHTLEWNTRARRCFLKIGFSEVRPVRRNGQTFILMELGRDRWEEIKGEKLARLGQPSPQKEPIPCSTLRPSAGEQEARAEPGSPGPSPGWRERPL